jgi:Ca2+-binding RTX toxin-like protein
MAICSLELLETRRLRSSSVTVHETYPGFFEIQGGPGNDLISVTVNQADRTFSIDGQTYSEASYIAANGDGGDDVICILSVDGTGSIGASVHGGEGDDSLTLSFDGAIWGGGGMDFIHLTDSFRGEADGEGGNDRIHIGAQTVDAEIRGGDGNDLIDCATNFYGVVVFAGAGNDTVYGSGQDDQIYGEEGNDKLYGGGGNDVFFAWDGDMDQVDGGEGYDVVYVTGGEGRYQGVEQVYYI